MADKEERENRPEAKQRFVEDCFPLMTPYAAILDKPLAAESDFEIGSSTLFISHVLIVSTRDDRRGRKIYRQGPYASLQNFSMGSSGRQKPRRGHARPGVARAAGKKDFFFLYAKTALMKCVKALRFAPPGCIRDRRLATVGCRKPSIAFG